MNRRSLLVAWIVCVVGTVSATGQDAFTFVPGLFCNVRGTVQVKATVTSVPNGAVERMDEASFDFKDAITLRDRYAIGLGEEAEVLAKDRLDDGCPTKLIGMIKGYTRFQFWSEGPSLNFFIESAPSDRSHENTIKRGKSSGQAGQAASVETIYAIPEGNALHVFVPFWLQEDGQPPACCNVAAKLTMSRSDSSTSNGSSAVTWQIWKDLNRNGEVDPGEPLVASDTGKVSASDTFEHAFDFNLEPEVYVIQYTYTTESTLEKHLAHCEDKTKGKSTVQERLDVTIAIK